MLILALCEPVLIVLSLGNQLDGIVIHDEEMLSRWNKVYPNGYELVKGLTLHSRLTPWLLLSNQVPILVLVFLNTVAALIIQSFCRNISQFANSSGSNHLPFFTDYFSFCTGTCLSLWWVLFIF